ncbi:MAG TPA: cytochrome c oxidase assembly factor Coa1 family protein [Polyangiales bacterium]|nr:cytochrome c oxidase assembly factor Coa1 family protein [Polyangiales bacterium]
MPPEIDRWNWGAFLLNFVWGLGNGVRLAWLMWVPLVGLAMPFVLGWKGNAWAWRRGGFRSVEHFQQVQRRWAQVGFAALGGAAISVVVIAYVATTMLKHSNVYQLADAQLERDERVEHALGKPFQTGTLRGNIDLGGTVGHAQLAIPIHGTRADGVAYVDATKHMDVWRIDQLHLEIPGASEIQLVGNETSTSAASDR